MPKSVDSTKIAEGYKSLLGTPLGRDISQHLQDENIVFVFPSQDTADSWARAVVYSEISRAVALNRFLGFLTIAPFALEISISYLPNISR